jgi:peptidoglycan/LPS O-acetylase OafA/YrhL
LVLLSIRPFDVLAVWPVAYVTVYLGLLTPKKVPLLFSGDYSYGIYLFAYPIQQALWLTALGKFWWSNLLLATVLSFGYAAFSWRCVEKPILDRKRTAVAFVEAFVDRCRAILVRGASLVAAVAGRSLYGRLAQGWARRGSSGVALRNAQVFVVRGSANAVRSAAERPPHRDGEAV